MPNLKSILAIIFFIAALGVGYFLTFPTYQEVGVLKENLKTKEEELRQAEERASQFEDLKKQYLEMEEEAAKTASVLPQGLDLPGLLVQVEALAAENGMVLEKIGFQEGKVEVEAETEAQPQEQSFEEFGEEKFGEEELGEEVGEFEREEKKPKIPYKTVEISMTLSGTYETFKNYLEVVEKHLRLMDVTSITFKGEEEEVWDFDIKMGAYYQ